MANIVSATFNDYDDAQRAVDWLRDNGVSNDAITVVGRQEEGRDYGFKGGAATLDRPSGLATDLDRDGHNDLATDLDRDGRSDLGLRENVDRGYDRDFDRDRDRPVVNEERREDAADMGKGALTGLGVGAGVGALFGLAAALIPGIGPFITAGALASTLGAAGGGAVAGAIVGGASGGLAGALAHWGLNEAESHHYAGEVERGSTYVGVDLDRTMLSRDVVEDAFRRFNGRMYSGR